MLLAEEAIDGATAALVSGMLSRQPAWSDLPIAIITSGGDATPERRQRLAALGPGGNVVLIERPVRPATLVSTMEAALRSRQRQFQVRDLLERTQRDAEALRESEERYRVLVSSGQAWVWGMAADGSSDAPPAEWVAYTGQTAEEATGNGWAAAIHPHDREAAVAEWKECVEARQIFETEYRVRRHDGAYRWFATRGVPIFSRAGELREWVGTMADIHDRRSAEEALRESESRQRLAMEAGAVGSWMVDVPNDLIYCDEMVARLYGVTPEQGRAGCPTELLLTAIVEEYRQNVRQTIARAAAQDGGIYRTEYPVRDSEGGERWLHGRGQSQHDSEGRPFRLHGVTVDVTERHRLQVELENERARLEISEERYRDADRRKDEFLAMLAHELRNPLSSVGNAVALLKETSEADDRAWAAEVIERQTRQLARLVDDLLDVSRITRGKIQLRRALLDAAGCLESACEAVAPLLAERNHTLLASVPRGSLWLEADPTRLEQIVVNLLANAAKYTDPGGHISLEAQSADDEIVITVRDNGIGLAPEKIPAMFELFAQGERSIARSEGGLGIGLTVVRGLCDLHGGSVSAHSGGLGAGSTFEVRLPAAAAPAGAQPVLSQPSTAGEGEGRRVLVVDDNVDTAAGLARLLSRRGYSVQIAHDGPAAMELARGSSPEIILLDIGLPGMDGHEVARQLRTEPPCAEALIIALSGYGQEEDMRRSLAAGFDYHLVKPVDFEQVRALLTKGRG